jgi:tRNA(Ile2) C34 agmatinyltransferase TiaS
MDRKARIKSPDKYKLMLDSRRALHLPETEKRKCLKCDKEFLSKGNNRRCKNCNRQMINKYA